MTVSSSDVIHQPDQNRFTLTLPDIPQPATLTYTLTSINNTTIYNLYSTHVPDSMRGQGVASKLVQGALQILRNNDSKIIPTCSYIPIYLKRNPQHADLVFQHTNTTPKL